MWCKGTGGQLRDLKGKREDWSSRDTFCKYKINWSGGLGGKFPMCTSHTCICLICSKRLMWVGLFPVLKENTIPDSPVSWVSVLELDLEETVGCLEREFN